MEFSDSTATSGKFSSPNLGKRPVAAAAPPIKTILCQIDLTKLKRIPLQESRNSSRHLTATGNGRSTTPTTVVSPRNTNNKHHSPGGDVYGGDQKSAVQRLTYGAEAGRVIKREAPIKSEYGEYGNNNNNVAATNGTREGGTLEEGVPKKIEAEMGNRPSSSSSSSSLGSGVGSSSSTSAVPSSSNQTPSNNNTSACPNAIKTATGLGNGGNTNMIINNNNHTNQTDTQNGSEEKGMNSGKSMDTIWRVDLVKGSCNLGF